MTDQAELTRPATREELQTVNPATGEPGRSYQQHTIEEGHEAAAAAHKAFREWRRTPFQQRGASFVKPPKSCALARTSSRV